MKRIIATALSSAMLLSLPALSRADEAQAEVKTDSSGTKAKAKSERTRPDGTVVKKEMHHEAKADGSDTESKQETSVKDPNSGAETKTETKGAR